MVRRKSRRRWRKDWHHRAPDFKLVYCGPKKDNKEETKQVRKEKIVEVSVAGDRDGVVIRKLERNRRKL
jgi:hypothetical protein